MRGSRVVSLLKLHGLTQCLDAFAELFDASRLLKPILYRATSFWHSLRHVSFMILSQTSKIGNGECVVLRRSIVSWPLEWGKRAVWFQDHHPLDLFRSSCPTTTDEPASSKTDASIVNPPERPRLDVRHDTPKSQAAAPFGMTCPLFMHLRVQRYRYDKLPPPLHVDDKQSSCWARQRGENQTWRQ